MNLPEARALALSLMSKHGLIQQHWSFRFDRAKRRFGCCSIRQKLIRLSAPLTQLNSEEQVKDTILHEIAHALTPGQGHNRVWKQTAATIGARPERCYSEEEVAGVRGRFEYRCPSCKHQLFRHRRSRHPMACSHCCKRFNHGRFHERFVLHLVTPAVPADRIRSSESSTPLATSAVSASARNATVSAESQGSISPGTVIWVQRGAIAANAISVQDKEILYKHCINIDSRGFSFRDCSEIRQVLGKHHVPVKILRAPGTTSGKYTQQG
jgi:predicted SprT family Zn-dependent metalloprotease